MNPLPPAKVELLDTLVQELKQVKGLRALALGGSHCTGLATESSDLDLGLFYDPEEPFSIEAIRAIAQRITSSEDPTVTGFYEWGPWVNGGAWISTPAGEVDFIYKNIRQLRETIAAAQAGKWSTDYEQQPPYGFSSLIFLAELRYGIPLYDPDGLLAELRAAVTDYPDPLRASVIQQSLWSAEFTLWQAGSFVKDRDLYNALGCFTRALKSMINALFSLNRLYPMGDKKALDWLEDRPATPPAFRAKVEAALLVADPDSLPGKLALLKELFAEIRERAEGLYRPYFTL